ncbi:MAG: AGE family epimerase/isomerase [Candidatus Handelsmanbacteria bacterium]|nr:AGE family epimerase/isomerase [Candidatus Handelsmanbacteria bacterium]
MKRSLVFALLLPAAAWAQPDTTGVRQRLETLLLENLLPFWYPGTVDQQAGGYAFNHDVAGKWQGPSPKALVTQARAVWFFSRLYNSPYGKPEHREAARHGFAFLRDRMWDSEYGGFYWEVSEKGTQATKPDKHLYAQGFGLYALAEYIRASQDPQAKQLAGELFHLLETRAYDRRFGGYREFFARDWGEAQSCSYMGGSAEHKLMNTHLHLMEPFTTYYQVQPDSLIRERLLQLIQVQSNAVVRKDLGLCTDRYTPDWTPLRGPWFDRVSYGHDVENVWLLIEAVGAASLAQGPFMDLYRTLFANALKYGFDQEQGGFYDSGPFSAPADRRAKVWWVQAEGLVAALYLYRLTGAEAYWQVFLQTLGWIEHYQVDRQGGDWHATIAEDGRPEGDKAGPWKGPYHNGRALLECLRLLDGLKGGEG